jgi:protein-L-isoaspartate(D-aspartate) O-methyltransferase
MVQKQLVAKGITDDRILQAFLEVPRHLFVDEALRGKAYSNVSLPIGEKQTMSQPYTVAFMTQLLQVEAHHKVLEIGCGSGYQTAILSKLASQVFSVEIIESLAQKAKKLIRELKFRNIHIKAYDGTLGWREQAPFDRIMITAAAPDIPNPLIKQLANKGRMVAPIGTVKRQTLKAVQRDEDRSIVEDYGSFNFVPLSGRFGWE